MFLNWVLQIPFVMHERDTVVLESDGEPAAFGVVMRDPASVDSGLHWFGIVDPSHRGRSLGSWLLGWAHEVVAQRSDEGPFEVRSMCPAPDAAAHRLFEAAGYAVVRTSWDMGITLDGPGEPVGVPDGVRLRNFETGRDERTFWEVAESAFAGHFGWAAAPYESWSAEWYGTDDWSPDRVLLAEVDGAVVGELAWIPSADNGYIASVGVLKEHRGKGIAQAMLRSAFADITAMGFARATLSVDTGNETGAVELYRRVGMTPIRESYVFQRAGA